MKIKCFLIIILFQLIFSFLCLAQWSTDPAQNLRVTTIGLSPKMVSDGAGGAYIVYKDLPLDLVHLYVQRLDKYGYRKFPGNGVMISDSSRYQGHIYFLINDQNGGTIIAFTDEYFLDELGNIAVSVFVQRIDSIGNKLWGDAGIAVDLYEQAELMPVSLTADSEGGCYVFWGVRHDRNNKELRAQHLDSSGNFLWDSSGVLISDQFVSYNHAIPCLAVVDEVGGSICHYYDSTGAKLQHIDTSSNLLWGNGVTPYLDGWKANMKEDGSGGVIIAGSYYSFYDDNTGVWYSGVGAQKINKDGNVVWSDQGVVLVDSVIYSISRPEIAIGELGNSFIVWRDCRNGDFDLYIQKLDPNGQSLWAENGINLGEVKFGGESGISPDDKGGAIINWHFKTLTEDAVYAQYINSPGEKIWSLDILTSSRDRIHDFQAISTNNVGIIGCWYETPPEIGIHTQQVSINGNLGEVIITDIKENILPIVPNKIFLFQNYPNPFNSETVIKYQLSRFSFVQITIYDLTGKKVSKLVNKKQKQGAYQVLWNGRNREGVELSSGMYFIQLKTDESVEAIKTLLIK